MDHSYQLHVNDDDDPTIDASTSQNAAIWGGWVDIGPVTFFSNNMAHLADVLEAASKAARAVAADQQYAKGEAS